MIAISYGGLAGAALGIVLGALSYGVLTAAIESRFRARRQRTAQDQAALAQEIALLRRGMLALDIFVFGGIGYWIGDSIAS